MIKLCDARMGLGKTQAAISYMNENPQKKFIYITPYLPEARRIYDGCQDLHFVEPSVARYMRDAKGEIDDENGVPVFTDKILHTRSKTEHTMELVMDGRNIATTHQAFLFYTSEMLDVIREKHYTLMIDESIQTLATLNLKPDDLQIAVENGLIKDGGDSYSLGNPNYDGDFFCGVIRLLKSRNLVKVRNSEGGKKSHLAFWTMPIDLILAFDEVMIMTYMFEGSDMYYLLKMNNVPYQKIGIRHDASGYHFDETITRTVGNGQQIKGLIHICDNEDLNSIGEDYHALSANKYRKDQELSKKMNSNLRSYFSYRMHTDSAQRLWTVFKSKRSKVGKDTRCVRRWLPMNARATNKYSNSNVLAYCVNVFVPTGKKMYYRSYGIVVDEDLYALSTMIQWIWRSAIRNGEEIWIYIPSRRMRELLQGWLDSLASESTEIALPQEGRCTDDGSEVRELLVG